MNKKENISGDKKIGFFKSAAIAITKFEGYKNLINQKASRVLIYFILAVIIFSVIVTGALSFILIGNFKNGHEYFKNEFPNFTFANNILKTETNEPLRLKNANNSELIAIIDTNASEEQIEKYKEEIKGTQISAIVLKDKVIVKGMNDNQISTHEYKTLAEQFNIKEFNKQSAIDYLASSGMIMIYSAVFMFVFGYTSLLYAFIILLDVIMLSALAFLTNLIYKVKLKYGTCVKLGVYALTLPLILKAIYIVINTFTGFYMEYFTIMYNIVAYIYVITVILMMRNELAKQDVGPVEEIQIKDVQIEEEKEETTKKEDKKENKNDSKNPKTGVEPEPEKA